MQNKRKISVMIVIFFIINVFNSVIVFAAPKTPIGDMPEIEAADTILENTNITDSNKDEVYENQVKNKDLIIEGFVNDETKTSIVWQKEDGYSYSLECDGKIIYEGENNYFENKNFKIGEKQLYRIKGKKYGVETKWTNYLENRAELTFRKSLNVDKGLGKIVDDDEKAKKYIQGITSDKKEESTQVKKFKEQPLKQAATVADDIVNITTDVIRNTLKDKDIYNFETGKVI